MQGSREPRDINMLIIRANPYSGVEISGKLENGGWNTTWMLVWMY